MKLATLLCLLSVVGSVSANEPPNAIRSCKSFAYLLQAEGLGPREQAIERLTGCDRDLIVMDYAYYGDAKSKWTRSEIERIRAARANRKVVAYLSLGEVGTYRFYWQTAWDSNKDGTPDDDAPSWLLAANPDWPDNYKVL
ncbi:MAG: hypothetical protein ACI93T_003541, partial [Porticoccaceae bacterium]